MKIKRGGRFLEETKDDKIVKEINVSSEGEKTVMLWLNDFSLSYLSIEEAIDLRDELNNAIRSAASV